MMPDRAARLAKIILFALEGAMVAALAALVLLAFLGLLMEFPALIRPPFLGAEQLARVLDDILAVFILLELLATAVAYIKGTGMVRRIMEAMLVALARKLISLDLAATSVDKAAALALLLVAIGVSWLLIARQGANTPDEAG